MDFHRRSESLWWQCENSNAAGRKWSGEKTSSYRIVLPQTYKNQPSLSEQSVTFHLKKKPTEDEETQRWRLDEQCVLCCRVVWWTASETSACCRFSLIHSLEEIGPGTPPGCCFSETSCPLIKWALPQEEKQNRRNVLFFYLTLVPDGVLWNCEQVRWRKPFISRLFTSSDVSTRISRSFLGWWWSVSRFLFTWMPSI